ncbi:hypothetical protein CEF21_00800 [Bacillus sp. FJAT-42376]|uniref:hypothetical protein n=1 Tax=Bacillus sp. FJAT-42376 TaxID=2014076 RepID=UPI000F4D6588|nr:hypothetical protein [Bacillus sp. FJAT-42376]AZB40996.1 hypothetical protein CEF21_00800 [Bacillus sp. FJAT-42376]
MQRKISSLLLFVLLVTAGCSLSVKNVPQNSNQDPNITAIKQVLHSQLTGPDSEFINGLDNIPKLEQYYEKRYKSYFTEEMYNSFVSAYAYNYLLMAHVKGQQLKVDAVNVKRIDSKDDIYDFKALVLYGKKGSNQKSAEVSGSVNFNKEGKITGITYSEDDGLSKELKD